MQCKNCGRDVKSDFKYCPYCANRLINDFEDHYGELNPPYVMPDLADQTPEDAAFLYGRSRVIPDEADTFFAPEQTTAPLEEADMPFDAPVEKSRPLPYEVYRPEPIGGNSGIHPAEDLPGLSQEDIAPAPELEQHSPRYESFRANLPDALPDDLPDLPDLPEEDFVSEPEPYPPPYEDFHANLPDALPDDLPDLPDLPDEDFAPEPEPYIPPHEKAAYGQPPIGALEWEAELPDDLPEEQHSKTLEDAPYVSMQPDVDAEKPVSHTRAAATQHTGPGMAIKLLLILFMVSLGVLASFVLYRFWGNLNLANPLELVPSAVVSCWRQAWGTHYFL